MDEEAYAALLCRMIAASGTIKHGIINKLPVNKLAFDDLKAVAIEANEAGVSQRLADDYAKYNGLK